jgi:hypothetical protein
LAIPFIKARNRRNLFLCRAVSCLLSAAAGFFHLAQLGVVGPLPPGAGVQFGLDVVLFIASVMAGRVVPMFTNNGVPGAAADRKPFVEKAALGLVLALLIADASGLNGLPLVAVAVSAAASHMGSVGCSGIPGARARFRSSGSCTLPTSGCRFTWRCAPAQSWASPLLRPRRTRSPLARSAA